MNMAKALTFYKDHSKFHEVFRSLGYGLRPNTLIGLLQDGRWYEFEFVAEKNKCLALVSEIPKPRRHRLVILELLNNKHFLN